MNYDNVKNPFDMYDDVDEIEELDDEEYLDSKDEQEEEKPANSRLLSVFMIVSYILILILAFFGIVALCNSETRGMKTIIDVFNYTFGSHLFIKGLNKSREAEKIDRENYAQQQNGNGNYQQTYNIPADNQTYDYPAHQQPPQVQPTMPQQRTPQQPPVQQSAPAYSNPPGWN